MRNDLGENRKLSHYLPTSMDGGEGWGKGLYEDTG